MSCRSIVSIFWIAALAAPMAAQEPQLPAAVEPPPPLAVPSEYRYDSRERRDPFINPIPVPPAPETPPPVVRPPGLRGILAGEADVVGIVTSSQDPGMTRAVISAPGNRTYFAAVGDALFDAVVKEIRPDAVVFLMGAPGVAQEAAQGQSREIVRTVHPTAGGTR